MCGGYMISCFTMINYLAVIIYFTDSYLLHRFLVHKLASLLKLKFVGFHFYEYILSYYQYIIIAIKLVKNPYLF